MTFNGLQGLSIAICLFFIQAVESETGSYSTPEEKQGLLIKNLQSYDIDFPTITDSEKIHLGFLSDGESRPRRRRAINVAYEKEFFHYNFKANGETYNMKLRINEDLFGPNFEVEHYYGDKKGQSVKMNEHCYLIGETIPQKHQVAVSDCDGLQGVINIDNDMLFIEPLLNDSYVDKSLLNKTGRPHLIYKHSHLSKNNMGLDALDFSTRIEPANNRRSPRPRTKIHYSYLTFINRSGRIVKLMWVDARKKRMYFATLMPGTSRKVNTFTAHRWLAVDEDTEKQFLIGNRREYIPRKNKQSRRTNVYITLPRGLKLTPTSEEEIRQKIGVKYIESMAVADKSVVRFHGKDKVARYILALMNVVSYIFKHKSIGFDINYVLVRIVLLHKKPKGMRFYKNNPGKTLLSACEFMHKIREGRTDDDPKFHDHATYLTRRKFGIAAGYAPVYGMCHPVQSCTLNLEDGFPSSFIIAHETGHSLGMEHDGVRNRCSSVTGHGSIMAAIVQSRLNRFMWSSCSRKALVASLRNFQCLNDKPGDKYKEDLPFLHKYPGVHYTTDDQCLFDFGKGYKFCTAFYRDPCQVLWCNMPSPHSHLCKSMRSPALNGTKCGHKRWCVNRRCVRRTEQINDQKPVHGKWGDWKNWGPCSRTCGTGVRIRKRSCDSPAPQHGGKSCPGKSTDHKVCTLKNCIERQPLRDEEMKDQCISIGEKNDRRPWAFYDETLVNLNCTFERGLCMWKNLKRDDQRDWILNRGRTRTSQTGPSVDHTTKTRNGQYIYYETSSPAKKNDKAAIASPDLGVKRGCLSFYYHMFGKGMGTLQVLISNNDGRKVLWTQDSNKGDKWFLAQVDIKEESLYNIIIEGTRKDKYTSDMALDDITFKVGLCNKNNIEKVNPCVVSCVTEGSRKKIIMNNHVRDGIRCSDNSPNNICIDGVCRKVGCDQVLDSRKIFDNCSICNGNGSTCSINTGNISYTPKQDMEIFLNIPKGSSNVNVQKRSNPNQLLVLSVRDPKERGRLTHVINGNDEEAKPAIYNGGGTQYVYTREFGDEIIKSIGIVQQEIVLNIKAKRKGVYSPVNVTYEFYTTHDVKQTTIVTKLEATARESNIDSNNTQHTVLPKLQTTSKTEIKNLTRWEVLNTWTPCSKTCGRGKKYLVHRCMVGDVRKPWTFCHHIKVNKTKKFRHCNTFPCTKRFVWVTGSWSACSKTCSSGIRTRNVTCKRFPVNRTVKDRKCKQEKPRKIERCTRGRCEPVWKKEEWGECSVTCGVGIQRRRVFCLNETGQPASRCSKHEQPISSRQCQQPACVTPSPSGLIDCDFEKDLCEWKHARNADFLWLRHKGKTKSSKTGPHHDHTFQNRSGHYMYIEASSPRVKGEVAALIGPEVPGISGCITFYYHMWGEACGSLKIKQRTTMRNEDDSIWERKGDQGDRWIKGEIDMFSGIPYWLVIEATRGRGWKGDIAVDDIKFHRHKDCREMHNDNTAARIHSGQPIKMNKGK